MTPCPTGFEIITESLTVKSTGGPRKLTNVTYIALYHLLDSTSLISIFNMHLIVQQGLWSFKLELIYNKCIINYGWCDSGFHKLALIARTFFVPEYYCNAY